MSTDRPITVIPPVACALVAIALLACGSGRDVGSPDGPLEYFVEIRSYDLDAPHSQPCTDAGAEGRASQRVWTISGEGQIPSLEVCTPAEPALRLPLSSIRKARLLSYDRGAANQGSFPVMLRVTPALSAEFEDLQAEAPESLLFVTHKGRSIGADSTQTPRDHGIPGGTFESPDSARSFYEGLGVPFEVVELVAPDDLAHSTRATGSACSFRESKKVPFTSAAGTDTLVVSVSGEPCSAATLTIRITSADSVVAYEYEVPYAGHTACSSNPDCAERLVRPTVEKAFTPESWPVPPFASEAERERNILDHVSRVDRSTHERLLSSGNRAFFHRTHYEEWRWVIFDPRSRAAVVVAAGGVWH